ncbi:hypothetical protein [Chitinophaga pinensis]|nr:hypothetical protein [Chitinophaga pinensis]
MVETIWKTITRFYGDHLPGSWSYYVAPWYEYVLFLLLYTVVFLIPTLLVFKIREACKKG